MGRKRVVLDDAFFEVIDSEEKAYWLGFLWADGCVFLDRNLNHAVKLSLQQRDRERVEAFRSAIGFMGSVTTTIPKRGQWQVVVTLFSMKMYKDLGRLGVVPRKSTKECQVPYLGEFQRHFLRGLFDGDGSAGRYGRGVKASIVGTSTTCQWVLDFVGLGKVRSRGSYGEWYICNRNDLLRFAILLYDNATTCLERKRITVMSLVEVASEYHPPDAETDTELSG